MWNSPQTRLVEPYQAVLNSGGLEAATQFGLATRLPGSPLEGQMKRKKLGEVLRERGHISPQDLVKTLEEQHGKITHLGELMLERGLVSKSDLARALEEVTGVPYVDCSMATPERSALKLISRQVAQRCSALPLARERSHLVTVMAEPQNLHALNELRFLCGMEISPRLGFRRDIKAAIERYYPAEDSPQGAGESEPQRLSITTDDLPEMEFVSTSSRLSNQEAMRELQAELVRKRTPAVRVVSEIIAAASSQSASDIHIEPRATDTVVRIRVDGVLRQLRRTPRALQSALVSRIKILSDMDIAERRTPQDGRFLVRMGGRKLDLRVSTLPTQYGEKVVMRLLEPEAPLLAFADLGMAPEIENTLREVLRLPQGMLLVTGPTGSGKSTTLYASLNLVRKPTVNIITVEDPVEYALEGINQVQLNPKADLTFANCLRSILRQDPNVIMVGEIRDFETAEIALKAAQTGHLVLSTLHTNDSVAAITRLLDLNTPAFLIASSVTAIIAQRLVRKLCACRNRLPVTPPYRARLAEMGLLDGVEAEYVPVGCAECQQTGYKGRVGIYEMLVFDEAIRPAVRSGQRTDELRQLATSRGMKLMQEDALEKVRQGVTSLEDVLRVVPFERGPTGDCPHCGRELGPGFLFCPYCSAKTDSARDTEQVALPKDVEEGAVRE